MAVISSLILNDDQLIPTSNSNDIEATSEEKTNTINTEISTSQQAILDEINALQAAMEADSNFDFTKLDATAAGNSNTQNNIETEKSSATPLLLAESDHFITYRADSSAANELSNAEPISNTDNGLTDHTENTLLSISNNKASIVESSLSEDFITRTEGQLANETNITEQSIQTQFGSFSIDSSGKWLYTLNNDSNQIQQLSSGENVTDTLTLSGSKGEKIQFSFIINGTNDQAVISGARTGQIQANTVADNDASPVITGKLNAADIDSGESRFQTNFDIQGNFGKAEINAFGEWKYTLDNNSDAIQGLRTGEKLLDIFSVKTLDGTKQLIQVSIEGIDDKPLLSGNNFAELNLESAISTHGKLTINDPDFGQSSFQELSGIRSSLGFGTAEIDTKGNWSFTLDIEYTQENEISAGHTRIDSFEVFTADGTSQMINIPIKGSDSPFYEQQANINSQTLTMEHVFSDASIEQPLESNLFAQSNSANFTVGNGAAENQSIESTMLLNSQNNVFNSIQAGLTDILTS